MLGKKDRKVRFAALVAGGLSLAAAGGAAATPGLATDCAVGRDPGAYGTTVIPPTGNASTGVTAGTGEQAVRLSSPGTRSYYVVDVGSDNVRTYGRRQGASNVPGDVANAEAHDVTIGTAPKACVSSPAGGVGVTGP